MELERIIFLGVEQTREPEPEVIETTGVEVIDQGFDVKPANANGAVAPGAGCVSSGATTVPFASTLRHIA